MATEAKENANMAYREGNETDGVQQRNPRSVYVPLGGNCPVGALD